MTSKSVAVRSPQNNFSFIFRLFVLGAAYYSAGWLGLQIPYIGSQIALVWLPTGIAVAALFRWGNAVWPAIYLGAFFVNFTINPSLGIAAGIALGNTLAPFLTVSGLKLGKFNPAFDRQRDVGLFFLATCLGMTVSASGGVANLYLVGVIPVEAVHSAWLSWWMSDTVGVLLAAPLLLTVSAKHIKQLSSSRNELLLWTLFASVVIWMAFTYHSDSVGHFLPRAFLTLPLLTWAALRFGTIGATFSGSCFSVIAAWSTATGHGYFQLQDAHLSLFLLWIYMLIVMLTGLLITALLAERNQVERTLRDSEQKLRGLFELSPRGAILNDMSGRFVEVNKAFQNISGYTAEELGNLDYWALTPKKYDADEAKQLDSLERTGYYGPYEKEYIRKDGSLIPVKLDGMLFTSTDGEKYIWSIVEDIRQRKIDEEQRQRLSVALMQSDQPVSLTDTKLCFVYANPAFCRLFGYELDELLGRHINLLRSPAEIAESNTELTTDIAMQQGAFEGEVVRRAKDGRDIPILIKVSPCRNDQGELFAFVGSLTDLTNIKRMENTLRESEKHFRDIIENSPLGMVTATMDGRFIHVNKAFCEIVGYAKEELEGRSFKQITSPDDIDISIENIKKLIDGKIESYRLEKRYFRKDGQVVFAQLDTSMQRNINGEPLHLISQIKNVTEIRLAEQIQKKLARSHKLLSECNSLLIHASDEHELLEGICRLAVETGGYLMVWVGYAENNTEKTIRAFAQSGYEEGYLESANITWADTPRGQGPTGTAIRTGVTVVMQDCLTNPRMAPWREAAIKRGYHSSIAIPLIENAKSIGVLTIYSADPFAFGEEEVALLEVLANNLSYGVQTLRTRFERQQTLTLLLESEKHLEQSNQQLRELTTRREEAREDERKRIARDLHDELGQILTALRMEISILRMQFGAGNPLMLEQIKNILTQVDSTIQVVRNVASKLRPSVLDMGIVTALEWQVAEFAKRSDIHFDLEIDELGITLDDERATAIFRIVQESITNVTRHAEASNVYISLFRHADEYVLEIVDDGKGFESEKSEKKTFGLLGIRERALMLNGTADISSSPGSGTRITVRIPVKKGPIK